MSGNDALYELDRYIQWMHARARPEDAAIIESIRTRVAALGEACEPFAKGGNGMRFAGNQRVISVSLTEFCALSSALRELGR